MIPIAQTETFELGPYRVVGQAVPGAAHMLRFTVWFGSIRCGSRMSRPTLDDCKLLHKPPPPMPARDFSWHGAGRGRPRKIDAKRKALEPVDDRVGEEPDVDLA